MSNPAVPGQENDITMMGGPMNHMNNSAMKAYQSVVGFSQTGRQADTACFRMLADLLVEADASGDPAVKRAALGKHQRLWSMIMKANALESGVTPRADRELFVNLANQCQQYGIRAILDTDLPLTPLIEVANNIIAGLEGEAEENKSGASKGGDPVIDDINLMF